VKTKKQNNKLANLGPYEDAQRAFERMLERMEAVPVESLQPIKLDLGRAAMIVIAAEPKIAALIPEMKRLPDFSVEHVRDLRDLALAAWYAHNSFRPVADRSTVSRLAAEAFALRKSLKQQARAFALVGLVKSGDVPKIDRGRSHWNLGRDLVALVQLLGKTRKETRVDPKELERAANLAAELGLALAAREAKRQGTVEETETADMRSRAFALLAESYGEVRRAVQYLRYREGDAGELAPSLYVARRSRSRIVNASGGAPPLPVAQATAPTPT
jgi:hypothetical protein